MNRSIGILIFVSLVMAMGCTQTRYFTSSDTSYIPVYSPNENCKLVSFKPGLEPAGFNGVKWETELSSLGEMKLYRKEPSHGGISFYLRAGDTYKIRNGKLLPIYYGFWRNKFYVGVVRTEQVSDWEALKESVFEKYGVGAKPFSNQEEYLWVGKDATMALRYDGNSKSGIYYIRSHTMEKKKD
jgi:hypothetical protein